MSAKMHPLLRVVIADDERPARLFLAATLRTFERVEIVGVAETGVEAVEVIERERPDLALLDLQMPELDGLGVVRVLKKSALPLIAFVTAYDDYAVGAFELNAVDYLLKPVDRARLGETLRRAEQWLERADFKDCDRARLRAAIADYEKATGRAYLDRIPVRQHESTVLVPVREIVSVVADGQYLSITTTNRDQYVLSYRLKELEARLDPSRFTRVNRGILVQTAMISRVSRKLNGDLIVELADGQQLDVSRSHARMLHKQLLQL